LVEVQPLFRDGLLLGVDSSSGRNSLVKSLRWCFGI